MDEQADRRLKAAAAAEGVDFSAFVVAAALERADRLERTATHRVAFEERVKRVLAERGEAVEVEGDSTIGEPTAEERVEARRARAQSFVAGTRRAVA
ncbi:DUF1778 domain-containing protein [Kitasatospora sp. NBC_00240]|uniref:type II toxin -antitoxin system TacA 1-like antitoxin n=1 Tax=Kitasatospora sp. NBC_00240 TaxID=2903567 RepID=UPI002255982C|nr:DUF1778 domain-containing protein [Kitasatospora sp. NBC_00240]MCX5210732.1 DUF1778 domain-containing protein [Kitasatospora sp. NBC_00240]